jgi:CRISPR-associated endonuclease/helicase Cas3
LRAVAGLASQFAESFGGGRWGYLAGLWHDLGKYRPGFQRYVRETPDAHIEDKVPGHDKTHSAAGALHAMERLGKDVGRVLAFVIAGHHAGLPDWETGDGAGASLQARVAPTNADSQREYREAVGQAIPADIFDAPPPDMIGDAARAGFALWLRMLFSALVDADFLDTEAYFTPDKAKARGHFPSLLAMKEVLDAHLRDIAMKASAGGVSVVNVKRAEVLTACRDKAALMPGFFTLTVPTGGGKTFSSLAFALEHALRHDKRRIIYAIPYTSIIEQTAGEFRKAFAALGEDCVVEHHSNLDVDARKEDHASRLAAENWDAPLIVTTNVQLFESLFAARPSRCRKLHNLVGSVIVLDEAQMLPRDFLAPVLCVLKLLVAHYGVTVVLCTATQPMLGSRREPITERLLLDGIDCACEIVEAPERLAADLKRVEVHMPADFAQPTPWETLADEIRQHDCVLAVVNSRRDARDLHHAIGEDAVHLSAAMCAAHRSKVIGDIRARLAVRREGADSRPLRVISTQLVEAGVDLDFPVVFRALAGLDSIAQAAGRCNREGRLQRPGQVIVFVPPHGAPPGLLKQGEQTTRELIEAERIDDPSAPSTFHAYFDRLYAKAHSLDEQGILELIKPRRAAFRTAAQRFRLIDDDSETVIVPYHPDAGSGEISPVRDWLAALAKDGNNRRLRRQLQRYTVNVRRRQFDALLKQGDVEECAGLWVALNSRYDSVFGLRAPDDHGNPGGIFG